MKKPWWKSKEPTNSRDDDSKDSSQPKSKTPILRTQEFDVRESAITSLASCYSEAFNQPNQDFTDRIVGQEMSALIVADGVGSKSNSHIAARFAVARFKHEISIAGPTNINIDTLHVAYKKSCMDIKRELSIRESPIGSARTTLICVVEIQDRFLILYIGDGGLVLTRGRGTHGVPLLMPHVNRKEHLESTIGATPIGQPTTMMLKKSLPDGEIFVVGTDGAFPSARKSKRTGQLMKELRSLVITRNGTMDQNSLDEFVLRKTKDFKRDDDTSLGLIITKEALQFWQDEFGQV